MKIQSENSVKIYPDKGCRSIRFRFLNGKSGKAVGWIGFLNDEYEQNQGRTE